MDEIFDRVGFLDRLDQVRKSAGLSKADFGKAIGVTNVFSRYNLGKPGGRDRKIQSPSVETLLRIHETFHVSVNWLLTGQDQEPPNLESLDELMVNARKRAEKDPDYAGFLRILLRKTLE